MLDTRQHTQDARAFSYPDSKEKEPKRKSTLIDIIEGKDTKTPESLTRLFSVALEKYPALASVEFELVTLEHGDIGEYKIVEDRDGMPIPMVIIEEKAIEIFRDSMDQNVQTVKMIADLLGVEVSAITPEILQLFFVAHELGHACDFLANYKSNPELKGWEADEEMEDHRQAALDTLPAQGMRPGELRNLLKNFSSIDQVVLAFPSIDKHPRWNEVSSINDLNRIQSEEYRLAPPEKYADDFAAGLLLSSPDVFGFISS